MDYISTRGKAAAVSAAQAIKQGIAEDGGLYLPKKFPEIGKDYIEELCALSYHERAARILSLFLEDYTKEELLTDCKAAYTDRFDGAAAPVKRLDGRFSVLELWHGPTCAFKDMALQIMPKLLSRALVKTGEERRALILVATSGDTGKAALEGYRDVPHTAISVFYPVDGVSRAQKRQMITQEGENVNVCAIRGNFDDAQTGVKRIFADRDLAAELDKKGFFLSSANSINWGRLAPQIVYYVSAYCDMISSGEISNGELIDVCVPTGNFGNILAGYIAKECGLPIGKLICASNSNNVLTDFLESGVYDRNRPFHTTVSPSMDILISSNLERLLYMKLGGEKTAACMKELGEKGVYDIGADALASVKRDFEGFFCSESECLETVGGCFEKYGYLIDTHTAVAVRCAEKANSPRKMLIVSTASAYKFAPAVASALGLESTGEDPDIFARIAKKTGTGVPSPLSSVFDKDVRFANTIEADGMKNEVRAFAESLQSH